MEHESTVMTLKLSSHYHTGNPLACYDWKSTPSVQLILYVFFDYEGVVDHEYTLQGQTINETNISIYRCWDISVMQCAMNSCKSGNLVSNKCAMTMHLPTKPSLCDNFYLNTIFSLLLISWCSMWLFSVLYKLKETLEGEKISYRNNCRQCNQAPVNSFKN
jgi:hypothetical protein